MKLCPTMVNELFRACLFEKESEIKGDNFIPVEGVVTKVVFRKDKIEKSEETIMELLNQLPETFRESSGGGWSFLNSVMDIKENLWAEQKTADELVCLGIAIKKVEFLMPREMWKALPGGMPYFKILI